jgi:hypothetical protein
MFNGGLSNKMISDQAGSLTNFLEYDLTFVLLVFALAIFGLLAFRSRNIRSFQFQISVFLAIWILGELINVLVDNGFFALSSSMQNVGYEIHLLSMIFFAVLLYARYYYSRRRGMTLMDNIQDQE